MKKMFFILVLVCITVLFSSTAFALICDTGNINYTVTSTNYYNNSIWNETAGNITFWNNNNFLVIGTNITSPVIYAINYYQNGNAVLDTSSTVGNTTDEIWGVVDNGTFSTGDHTVAISNETARVDLIIGTYILDNQTAALAYTDTHAGTKHGNTTAEIRAQLTGSDNITIVDGKVSINATNLGTTYTNGTGISLVGNVFSIVLSYFQGIFYDSEGDLTTLLDDNYMDITATFGNCSGTNCVIGWGNITGVPSDLADGDDDTTYSDLSEFTNDLNFVSNYTDINVGIINGTLGCGNITGATSTLCTLVDTDTTISNETTNVDLIIGTYIPDNQTAALAYTDTHAATKHGNTTGEIFGVADNETWVRKTGDTINGNIIINGNLTLIGDVFEANVTQQNLNGSFYPQITNLFDIGSPTFIWNEIYATTFIGNIDWANLTNVPKIGNTTAEIWGVVDNETWVRITNLGDYANMTDLISNETPRVDLIIDTYIPDNQTEALAYTDTHAATKHGNTTSEIWGVADNETFARINDLPSLMDNTTIIRNYNTTWVADVMDNLTIIRNYNTSWVQSAETDTLSLHLTQDNWAGDDWITYSNPNFIFNESQLETVYYNATQAGVVAGTVDGGTLADTQHPDGNYDGVTFNFTEASGSPGLDVRINFTGISDFNAGVMRYKTGSLSGEFPIIQLWSDTSGEWEDYPSVGESETFATIEQPVFDSTGHINNSIVQMRIYKAGNGNTNNHYFVDWIAISKGYGTPAGEEVDPYSIHRDGNTTLTSNWDAGLHYITALGFNGNWNNSNNYYTRALIDANFSLYAKGEHNANETPRFDTLAGTDCGGTDKMTGVGADGTPVCEADVDTTIGNETTNVDLIIGTYIPDNYTSATDYTDTHAATKHGNTTAEIWNVIDNETFAYLSNFTNYYRISEIDANFSLYTKGAHTVDTTISNETTRMNDIYDWFVANATNWDIAYIWGDHSAAGYYSYGGLSGENITSGIVDKDYIDSEITRDADLAYIDNCTISNSCPLITYDTELAYINNCTVEGSCDLITYDSELTYTVDTNCTDEGTCGLITYDTELAYIGNCSGNDCTIGWGNLTGVPADIADGDDFEADTTISNETTRTDLIIGTYIPDNYTSATAYTDTHAATKHGNTTAEIQVVKVDNASYADDTSLFDGQLGSYYLDDTDTNCTADGDCPLIAYDSELAYIGNCSGADCNIGCGNLTGADTDFCADADTTYSALSEFTNDLNFVGNYTDAALGTINGSLGCGNITGATSTLCTLVDTDTVGILNYTNANLNLINGTALSLTLGAGNLTGTIDNARISLVEDEVPTLSSTWDNTMDADRLTGLDFLNTKILLDGANITTGTVATARLSTATPEDGVTTSVSTADQIFDYIAGLAYATTSYVDGVIAGIGNWTDDKGDYSTTAEAGALYAPVNYGDDWNKTYADGLYADISVTDTTISNETVKMNEIYTWVTVNATNWDLTYTAWNTNGSNWDKALQPATAIAVTSVNTGFGANELYPMNQPVLTTSYPAFAGLNITGLINTTAIRTIEMNITSPDGSGTGAIYHNGSHLILEG